MLDANTATVQMVCRPERGGARISLTFHGVVEVDLDDVGLATILFAVEEAPIAVYLAQRPGGAPQPASKRTVRGCLEDGGHGATLRVWVISSSYGFSGAILAERLTIDHAGFAGASPGTCGDGIKPPAPHLGASGVPTPGPLRSTP